MAVRKAAAANSVSPADMLLDIRDEVLDALPVTRVPTDTLAVGSSPRLEGEDSAYARTLAMTEGVLPPILVHHPTMRVIDGGHRLAAARLAGRDDIAVRLFHGSVEQADLLSVACNIIHGRPLSTSDRVFAAGRIVGNHPDWSDRSIASLTGLSAYRVAQIRKDGGSESSSGDTRVGQDGRVRPLNAAEGRELACRLMRQEPEASLRRIARQAGISPATVADVRRRLLRGDDPVPSRLRRHRTGGEPGKGSETDGGRRAETADAVTGRERAAEVLEREPEASLRRVAAKTGISPPTVADVRRRLQRGDHPVPAGHRVARASPPKAATPSTEQLLALSAVLRKDPSLRCNEVGRKVLRLFDSCAVFVQQQQTVVQHIPPHSRHTMAALLSAYAALWETYAEELLLEIPSGEESRWR